MELDKATQVRVGLFVLSGLLLAAIVIFMIGSERSWFEKKYHLYATFDDVSGLGPGASVSLAGMHAGSVKAVLFPEDLNQKHVQVDLELNTTFKERIREDSRVSIVTQGLLGDKQIAISVGSAAARSLDNNEQIQTEQSGDLFSMAETARKLMGDTREAVTDARRILNEVETGSGLLHALLSDPAGAQAIRDIGAAAHSARRLAAQLDTGEFNVFVQNLNSASRDVKTITGQIKRGEGTLGGFLTDASIYNDVRAMFGKAKRNVVVKSVIRSMLQENERNAVGSP